MPYIITRTKKKSHKMHISVCEQCQGMKCFDYRNHIQLTLFPSFIQDRPPKKSTWVKRVRPKDTETIFKKNHPLMAGISAINMTNVNFGMSFVL